MKKTWVLFIAILSFAVIILNNAISYNFDHVNVTTQVNVTNAYPEILDLTISPNILLNAGTTKTVYCNISVRDWNGYDDINITNATFWDNGTDTMGDPDNNNSHYTNTDCTLYWNDTQYIANYSCGFNVLYYANPTSNWTCNVSVIDNYNFTDWINGTTTIQTYLAINVTPTIDFGNMAVGDTKNNITANVTNFGNADINISVDGYGVTDGDGLAMDCAVRNITMGNLRYSINGSQTWAQKTNITDSPVNISGITVPKRNDTLLWNTTYWDLYIPPSENPFGFCNGTVVFTAQAS